MFLLLFAWFVLIGAPQARAQILISRSPFWHLTAPETEEPRVAMFAAAEFMIKTRLTRRCLQILNLGMWPLTQS